MRIAQRITLLALIAATAFAVSACSTAKNRRLATEAQRDLVGISRDMLLQCAGKPAASEVKGEREHLSYITHDPDVETPMRGDSCVATFLVRRGYVEHVFYETVAGRMVAQREICLPLVEPCMTATQ